MGNYEAFRRVDSRKLDGAGVERARGTFFCVSSYKFRFLALLNKTEGRIYEQLLR